MDLILATLNRGQIVAGTLELQAAQAAAHHSTTHKHLQQVPRVKAIAAAKEQLLRVDIRVVNIG